MLKISLKRSQKKTFRKNRKGEDVMEGRNGVPKRQRDPVWDSPKEEKRLREKLIRFSIEELKFPRDKAETWANITFKSFKQVKTL
jgi:hypothetical protein